MCTTTRTELPVNDKNTSGCSCCATGAEKSVATATGNTILRVRGMTCGHCVSTITEKLEEIDGVRNVSVVLDPGGVSTVTVDADPTMDTDRLHASVTDAGYEVATS